MKKTYILLLIILQLPIISFSQQKSKNIDTITIMQGISKLSIYTNFKYQDGSWDNETFIDKLSFAVSWDTKRGNELEVELSDVYYKVDKSDVLDYNGEMAWYNKTNSKIGLRISYIGKLCKNKNWKIKPNIGLGINSFYIANNNTTNKSQAFNTKDKNYGLQTSILPGLEFILSKKISFSASYIQNLLSTKIKSWHVDNPALPRRLKNHRDFITTFNISEIQFKLGLSFMF